MTLDSPVTDDDTGRQDDAVAAAPREVVEHVDVLIVGAGLSGIGAACHLQRDSPGRTYLILESRGAIGGTWDLFRYPGVRSDSDMFTLGYSFRPWTEAKAIADGPSIRRYIEETARDHRVEERIRFHHRVTGAQWSTEQARWTVTAQRTDTGETVQFTCSWLSICSGYYRGFTEAVRHELAEDGVGVTCVHPGGIRTRIAENARTGPGVSQEEYDEGRRQFARLLRIDPADAAAQIVTAIEHRRPRLLIGWSATIPDALARLLPGTYWRLLAVASGRPVRGGRPRRAAWLRAR